MSRLSKTTVLLGKTLVLLLALLGAAAQADDQPTGDQGNNDNVLAPPGANDHKVKLANPDKFYLGVGMFDNMINANVEVVTKWGNFMLRGGHFRDLDSGFAGNMSWRLPLKLDDALGSGYYIGLFGGQISGDVLAGKSYQRVGGGAELGYHWVAEYTRIEMTVGIGAAQSEKPADTNFKLESGPTAFFNVNVALGY